MPNLTPQQKNKILAAADIVEHGDLAVLKKILEFQDLIEGFDEKFNSNKEEIKSLFDEKTTELKSVIDETLDKSNTDVSSDIESLYEEIEKVSSDLEEFNSKESVSKEDLDTVSKQLSVKINALKKLIPTLPSFSSYESRLLDLESNIPSTDTLIDQVLEKIPTLPEEITGETIVDKINDLPINEENQIDYSHIKNAPQQKEGQLAGSTARNLWQLQDVAITEPMSDEHVVKFNTTSNQWENDVLITVSGSAPADPYIHQLWLDIGGVDMV